LRGSRFPPEVRWPGVLGRCMGPRHRIVEDGLNGRTLCGFHPDGDPLYGGRHVHSCLQVYDRVDLLVLYLGINDILSDPGLTAEDLGDELSEVLEILGSRLPELAVVLLTPLPLRLAAAELRLYGRAAETALRAVDVYCRVGKRSGCAVVETGAVIQASAADGVHIDAEGHVRLGKHLCGLIRGRFGGGAQDLDHDGH